MRTEYLYEFIVLTQFGNFQMAADSLFISQSSLSKHIQSIESELGFPLLRHNKNKFALTPEGMEFLPYANKICDLRIEYTELFKNRGNSRKLDIGTCHFTSIEDDIFSNAILRLSTEYPDCLIRTPPVMSTDNIDELLTENEHGRVPCVIAKTLSKSSGDDSTAGSSASRGSVFPAYIKSETLYRWPLSILTRKDHPLAGNEISLGDIEHESLISLAYPTFANALAVNAFRSVGLIPVFSNTLNSFRSICDFVKTGKGIFVVTEPINLANLPAELCITQISPTIVSETFVAYNTLFTKDHELRFLEILKEEFGKAPDPVS